MKIDLLLTYPPYNVCQKFGRLASLYVRFSEDGVPVIVDMCGAYFDLGGHVHIFCSSVKFRSKLRLFFPKLKASLSSTPRAMSKCELGLCLNERSKDWNMWKTGVILIGKRDGKVFIASTWSRAQCTYRGDAGIWIVWFWMWTTIFKNHTSRNLIRAPMWR